MAQQQSQFFCNRCGKMTLHTRNANEAPHVLHLLMTILCLGLWLIVWFLDVLIRSAQPEPWRCTQCGQKAGELTPEQRRQREVQLANHVAGAMDLAHSAASATESAIRALLGQLVAMVRATPAAFLSAVRMTDAGLRRIAGRGNDIVYRFLQVLAVIVAAGAVVFTTWMVVAVGTRAVSGIASRAETSGGLVRADVQGVAAPARGKVQSIAAQKKFERLGGQGAFHFFWIDHQYARNRAVYDEAIGTVKARNGVIAALFWTDPAQIPDRLPMTDAQVKAQVAAYNRNANTGYNRLLFIDDEIAVEAE